MFNTTIVFSVALLFLALVVTLMGAKVVRQPVLGVYAFVFLSSITEMPNLPVVGDRLAVADFVMVFTILVAAVKGQLFLPAPRGFRLIDQLGLSFIILATVSSLLALFTRGDPIRVFLFLFIYIYGYLCFRLVVRVIDTPDKFYTLCLWWAAGAALVIVVGFLASTGIYKPSWTYDPVIMRINSTMKMSGQVASYLAPAMFILFYLATVRTLSISRQFILLGLIVAGAVVLIGTGSRIGFVMLLFVLLYGLVTVLTAPNAVSRKAPIMLCSGLGFFFASAFVVSVWTDTSSEYGLVTTSPFERAIKIFSEQSREDADISELGGTRYVEIKSALDNFYRNPLTGTGSGLFSSTYNTNEIHNTYISILAENGLLAFIVFMAWWGLILLAVLRAAMSARGKNKLMLRLVLGGLVVLSLYQLTTNGMRQRPFWFIPGIALAAVVITRPKTRVSTASISERVVVQ